jgi:hypothetical protein
VANPGVKSRRSAFSAYVARRWVLLAAVARSTDSTVSRRDVGAEAAQDGQHVLVDRAVAAGHDQQVALGGVAGRAAERHARRNPWHR